MGSTLNRKYWRSPVSVSNKANALHTLDTTVSNGTKNINPATPTGDSQCIIALTRVPPAIATTRQQGTCERGPDTVVNCISPFSHKKDWFKIINLKQFY